MCGIVLVSVRGSGDAADEASTGRSHTSCRRSLSLSLPVVVVAPLSSFFGSRTYFAWFLFQLARSLVQSAPLGGGRLEVEAKVRGGRTSRLFKFTGCGLWEKLIV